MNSLKNRALKLEYATIVWNLMEGIVSMLLGSMAGSISLFAYGLESTVEVFASGLVVWELKGSDKKREAIALKLIGAAYLLVSAYIFIDATQSLLSGHQSERTTLGIIFMVITGTGMAILGLLKRDVGVKMKSKTVIADAKFTLVDAALSTTVLVGLGFNYFFGWWWMDQALALFLAGVAFREGLRELL